ncbi:uncharacterized protein LOC117289624 isoform X2 [Asterias rubens]|uniref:uncharacterized protein LOC117289624 isoform X2 n=1 Tax=Asterias rubens TaxID=7604 RepID=UPI001455038C|nr:uncharacterized protein LOC117289624 isoform X2 [Asterias rubens]
MSAPFFPTPAGVQDYTDAQNYQKWSNFIRDSMNDTIKEEEKTVDVGNCQFYNPEIKPAGDDRATAKATWNGFPRRLEQDHPNDYLEIADKHDGWPHDGPEYTKARNQDEYLEWYVYKNAQGKITRVDFTCEGPEYWDLLFQWEPETCLALYQQYISADVKMEDLYTVNDEGKKEYNSYNKWNTTDGCMHLNCPPNSLSAEIRLAGDASIIRQKNDQIITDSQELINCSKYGRPDRNSDPKIGSVCNTLCREGKRITVGNPVCLFIANVKNGGWRTPDGEDAFKYMKLVRGTKEQGLRYSLEVPASEGFTVGDITIGGEPIYYGGSIAYLTDVALIAEYSTNEQGAQQACPCIPDDPTFLASQFTLTVANLLVKAKTHCVHRGYNANFSPYTK